MAHACNRKVPPERGWVAESRAAVLVEEAPTERASCWPDPSKYVALVAAVHVEALREALSSATLINVEH